MVAVVALPVLLSALFALLFILAWKEWGQVIVNTISVDVPVIGNVLGGLVQDALNIAYAGAVLWLDNVVEPLGRAILSFLAPVENTITGQVTNADYNAARLVQFFSTTLPALATGVGDNLAQEIENLVGTGINTVDPGIEDVLKIVDSVSTQDALAVSGLKDYVDYYYGWLQTDIANLSGTVTTVVGITADQVNSIVGAAESKVESDIQTAYQAATSYAQSLAETLQQDIATEAANVTALATTAASTVVGSLVTDLDNAIAGTLSGIWTDVDSAVVDLIGVIGADDPDILAAVRGISVAVPTDIPGVAALAGTTALALTRYLKDCGIPNCKNLSGFGNDLQALFGLVGDASFITLLIELIQHPSDASATVNGLFGTTIDTTVTAFRDLIGV